MSGITYWTLTNQGSDMDIQLRLHYSQSLKPCKSGFQIISSHSAWSICCFWHCQSSDPPVHPHITGHHWDSTSLVWILSHWQVLQGGLGRGVIHRTSTGHWGSSCPPCHSNSTAWLHDSVRFINNYPVKLPHQKLPHQKSWCYFWWPADFQRPHYKNCSILQVCSTQPQKDQALPYTACPTTSCRGPHHF